MKIHSVVYSIGRSGYFNKDLAATKSPNARVNGSIIEGTPICEGYKKIVQPGHIISVILFLENGEIAIGECADVIFSGAAGRDRLFIPEDHMPLLEGDIKKWLVNRDVSTFRKNAEEVDAIKLATGKRLHTALRYGLTQALLVATSLAKRITIAEVISWEYGTEIRKEVIDILVSCHRGDTLQLDRMIIKRVALMPHASYTTSESLGSQGKNLIDYVASISARIQEIGDPDYRPRIHIDVYGTIGELFDNDIEKITEYLGQVSKAAKPFDFIIESPIIAPTFDDQINLYQALLKSFHKHNINVKVIVDEWANTLEDIKAFADAGAANYVQIKTPDLGGVNNTIEAVKYCKEKGMGCCLGGTANETDLSARISAQIGLATGPDFMLSKPGIGADEGLMILHNEMARTIAIIQAKSKKESEKVADFV